MGRPHLTADERAIEESAEVLVASGWAGPHEHERLYLLDRLSATRAERLATEARRSLWARVARRLYRKLLAEMERTDEAEGARDMEAYQHVRTKAARDRLSARAEHAERIAAEYAQRVQEYEEEGPPRAAVRVASEEVAALRRALTAAERDAQQAEAALADGIRAEDAAMALGAERERAAIVAWLRAESHRGTTVIRDAGVMQDCASAIRAGAHIAAPEVPDPAGPFRISQHLTAPIVKAPPKPRDLDADGLRTPSGYVRIEAAVYVGPNRVVVAAWPDAEDERHDCDAMGCGQEHIAATIARADWYGPVPDGVAAPEVPDAA